MSRTVLVVTGPNDSTAELVIQELNDRKISVFRVDTGDFPLSLQVSAHFDHAWRGELRGTSGSVALSDIQSIYIRRPTGFGFPPAMTDSERRFATREARRGLGGLLMSLPCQWVNHPSRVADAEYKPLQLATAVAVGLNVPRTVVTNVPGDANHRNCYLGSSAVYKTLASASVADGSRVAMVYTTEVSAADMEDERVALTIHQFQERIPKVRDIRATVVGNRVFAASIFADKSTNGTLLDWRCSYSSLRYEQAALPDRVKASLLALLERLGLTFAAADFLVTPEGQYYFVDLNPAGEWGWIQEATGLPIAGAIADQLMGDAR